VRERKTITLQTHLEALRAADDRFREERDRRYAEVNAEKEKALKIKEAADEKALLLAREIQTYKDEKANELRTQIERERGDYATQVELKGLREAFEIAQKPVIEFMAAQAARASTTQENKEEFHLNASTILALIAVLVSVIGSILIAFHK
jgi:hypothetical protein